MLEVHLCSVIVKSLSGLFNVLYVDRKYGELLEQPYMSLETNYY